MRSRRQGAHQEQPSKDQGLEPVESAPFAYPNVDAAVCEVCGSSRIVHSRPMAKTMPKNTTEFFPEAELCPECSESPEDSTQERPFECKAKHAALSTHRAHFSNRRVSDESDALPAANSKATVHGRGAKVQELLGCRYCGRAQTLFDAGPAEIKRSPLRTTTGSRARHAQADTEFTAERSASERTRIEHV